ncbi:MAG TPA: DinB family protein [Roseiflexaceae bacterium]|nr:DinB family protein [Roseiflexaceae bacterium]
MNCAWFLEVLEASWRQLDEAIEGLDDAAMTEPGVTGAWSVKDLLGHVAAWEQLALRHIEDWRAGAAPQGVWGPAVDSFNAAESERRREAPLAAVREELTGTRQRLRAALAGLTDSDWDAVVGEGEDAAPLSRWVGGSLGGALGPGTHAAEHAHQILLWRLRRTG